MPSREQYVAQRIGARMQARGEQMVLRRTTMGDNAVPYRNPPDVSNDLVVTTGVADSGGQAYLGVSGSSVIGRLTAGDQIYVWAPSAVIPTVIWLVGVMPPDIATDGDGIPLLDGAGLPVIGTPTPYSPDALAAGGAWKAIPVSADGNPAPAASVGLTATLAYAADQFVYGNVIAAEQMVALGWTELDSLGIRIAAYAAGAVLPPQVDDQLIVNGQLRSILAIAPLFSNGIDFTYTVQAR